VHEETGGATAAFAVVGDMKRMPTSRVDQTAVLAKPTNWSSDRIIGNSSSKKFGWGTLDNRGPIRGKETAIRD